MVRQLSSLLDSRRTASLGLVIQGLFKHRTAAKRQPGSHVFTSRDSRVRKRDDSEVQLGHGEAIRTRPPC